MTTGPGGSDPRVNDAGQDNADGGHAWGLLSWFIWISCVFQNSGSSSHLSRKGHLHFNSVWVSPSETHPRCLAGPLLPFSNSFCLELNDLLIISQP